MSGGWLKRFRSRWKPPRTLKVTRAGRTYLVITLGVGLGALNTGNNLLYLLLGFLLSVIVASGVLSERALRHLRLRRLLPDAAFAHEPFAMRYEISRLSGHSFALTLSEEGSAVLGEGWAPVVSSAAKVVRADCVAGRRGPLKLSGVVVTTVFPLGLFAKSRTFELPQTLLVFPRRGFVCQMPSAGGGDTASEGGNPRLRDGTGDILGLRELAPMEDARRVHWLKSAAVGKLLKVEREREECKQFVLQVDAALPLEALDRQCEETAAQARRLLSTGNQVGLRAGDKRLRPAQGPQQERRLLSALAWLGFEGEAADDEALR